METMKIRNEELNLEATELRLGLPGNGNESDKQIRTNKRSFPSDLNDQNISNGSDLKLSNKETAPAAKAQVVGWPPIRSYRKNSVQAKKAVESEVAGMYVKIGMDGAPYLRKIDLKMYDGYSELVKAMEDMFKFRIGSEYASTYEDKDGDWMLVGDVPWEMFVSSCKRLRIMKGSEARGLGCVV